MRRLRLVFVIVLFLALTGAGVLLIVQWMSRREAEQSLARQAEVIAAHREAQRAEPPPLTAPAIPTATSAPDSPALPALVWTLNWTDFRGARRDGQYTRPIRTDWSTLKPMWKQPVGGGHASFVAAEGRAFTIEQRGPEEVAAAYDVLTGRELWTHSWKAAFVESNGGPGPRATPTFHDGTLFALGATGELRALDASNGKLRWRANILDDADAGNLYWAMSASPLVFGNTVLTVPGGGNGRSLVAYDRATGRIAWSALDDEAAYSSPMRVRTAGVEQIVVLLGARVVGVSADRGALLWEFPWPTQGGVNAAQPVVISENRVFVSSGVGGAVVEITRDGDPLSAREVWRTQRMKNDFTSAVHHEGFIYGLDAGILACLDAATGESKWKAGRYGHGQVLVASGHLVVTTEEGEVVLVRATSTGHQELAKISAVEGRTWNHPAIADGFLLVRNGAQMAAFDLRPR
jgi:outer membrane protein assembly factor BamB